MTRPWDRRAKESAPAFEAFRLYRDAGVERSAHKVGRSLGKSVKLMDRWCARHQWVDRALAYDDHLDGKRVLDNEERMRDMNEKHLKLAVGVQNKVLTELDKRLSDPTTNLSNADIVRWLEASTKLELSAMGRVKSEDEVIKMAMSQTIEAVAKALMPEGEEVMRRVIIRLREATA